MSLIEWKDIIGYEGSYQVSNIGEVKSLAKIRKGNRDNAFWLTKEKILSHRLTTRTGSSRTTDLKISSGQQYQKTDYTPIKSEPRNQGWVKETNYAS